jgi:hypothetical protein
VVGRDYTRPYSATMAWYERLAPHHYIRNHTKSSGQARHTMTHTTHNCAPFVILHALNSPMSRYRGGHPGYPGKTLICRAELVLHEQLRAAEIAVFEGADFPAVSLT